MRWDYWRHSWKTAVLVSLGLLLLVECAILLLYPPEEWLWELTVSGILVVGLTMPTVVHFAGQSHENRELAEELERLVNRDRLTDAATRDYFFSRMDAEPEAYGVSLMIDIDHFKSVNDTHGHIAGDVVIKMVADILKAETREEDIVCRFGGEEFIIFLHEIDASRGWSVAERMRERVEQTLMDIGDANVRVTISIGGALKVSTEHIVRAISAADTALYRAKALGRNRTEAEWDAKPPGWHDEVPLRAGMPR